MDIDMKAGHRGASGRFDRLREMARAYAFALYVKDRSPGRAQALSGGS
jgi:protease II